MHAQEQTVEFTPSSYPSFPDNLKTAELSTISLRKLLDEDDVELDRAFESFKTDGFVYLELSEAPLGQFIGEGSEKICKIGEEFFTRTPNDVKSSFLPGNKELFGYKVKGATQVDADGTRDTSEFLNISKNDMIRPEALMKRRWPSNVMANQPLLADYCKAAHGVGLQILCALGKRLGIDKDEIISRHRLEDASGDHIRITRGPARDDPKLPEISVPSHTDFGTITILMNWLGGLQVWSAPSRKPGSHEPDCPGEWLWVKPKKNCAIANLGDAAVKFTNGVLCSGRHRVVPAPGEQGLRPRYSLVYFVRPSDHSIMQALPGDALPPTEKEGKIVEARQWIYEQSLALGIRDLDN